MDSVQKEFALQANIRKTRFIIKHPPAKMNSEVWDIKFLSYRGGGNVRSTSRQKNPMVTIDPLLYCKSQKCDQSIFQGKYVTLLTVQTLKDSYPA